jgi:hypothetical protein
VLQIGKRTSQIFLLAWQRQHALGCFVMIQQALSLLQLLAGHAFPTRTCLADDVFAAI